MKIINRYFLLALLAISYPLHIFSQKTEAVAFGNMDQWLTRVVKESSLLGGETKQLFELAPTGVQRGNIPYLKHAQSPWATSSVMANIMGIIKTSCTVFPEKRGDGYAARLETRLETCKVLGMVNITVVASGTIYLGEVDEPIRNTKNPQSKLMMGIPFTKRPKAVVFDYKVKPTHKMVKATGFGKVEHLPGRDSAEVCLLLQHRWEDSEGNVYAKRVGTGYQKFGKATTDWVNQHEMPVLYGDITRHPDFKPYMSIVPKSDPRYCRNSKGEVVPIQELGWAAANEKPTHIILRFSASDQGAMIGSPGSMFWVDNVAFQY